MIGYSFQDCVNKDQKELVNIIQHLKMLTHAQQLLITIVPQEYKGVVRIANIRQRCIILSAANSSVATKIRFLQHTILDHFRQHHFSIDRLMCKISRNQPPYSIAQDGT